MSNLYELTPRYDTRDSFYGKAKVLQEDDGSLTLFSYDTKVAYISSDNMRAEVYGTHSQTTLRHIKEFLKQEGFYAENKKQIMADYSKVAVA